MTANGRVLLDPSPKLVGEVIESSTTDFVAQACELDEAPPFGTFVQVTGDDGITVYGVVAQVQTSGIDPGARPIMRGHGEVRDELIYAENPDLPHVLRTTFRALIVGFSQHGACRQFLPARPPKLHYSVSTCGPLEVRQLTDAGLDYLGALLGSADSPADELVAANIRIVAALRGETFTHDAGRELAQLLRGDYPRLTAILRRCVDARSFAPLRSLAQPGPSEWPA